MERVPTVLHADLDAFYASVEQLLDPSLRGRPIAVGGSVVLAASYEARAFGVKGAMVGWKAKQLCPDLLFVSGHFSEYRRLSDEVMAVFADFTPFVEQVSIDEAFLNVAGAMNLFGPPATIAARIRERVRADIGLPISVGVASTKHLAKIASQVAKPDGLVVVDPDRELEFLAPLPVGLVWGIGPVAERKLHEQGITTIGQMAEQSPGALERVLGGAIGAKVFALAANADERSVEGIAGDSGRRAKSIGSQSAFRRRPPTPELVRSVLGSLADRVAGRLRAKGRMARTVTVRVRFAGMEAVSRSLTPTSPVSETLTLAETAEQLVWKALADHPNRREITLLAISASNLIDGRPAQLELAVDGDGATCLAATPTVATRAGTDAAAARSAIDRQMDAVRLKFGRKAIGYASVAGVESVPDDFRSLAEHNL